MMMMMMMRSSSPLLLSSLITLTTTLALLLSCLTFVTGEGTIVGGGSLNPHDLSLRSRSLQEGGGTPPAPAPAPGGAQDSFKPLKCNDKEHMSTACTLWTPQVVELDLVVIPCGQCVILDVSPLMRTTTGGSSSELSQFIDPNNLVGAEMLDRPPDDDSNNSGGVTTAVADGGGKRSATEEQQPQMDAAILDEDGGLAPVIEFAKGLDIQGRLEIIPGTRLTLRTPFVLIQGELFIKIDTDTPISFLPDVRIILTSPMNGGPGFHAIPDQQVGGSGSGQSHTGLNLGSYVHGDNAGMCGHKATDPTCKMGKRGFVVAGGKLDLRGYPYDHCPSWVQLLWLQDTTITPDPPFVPHPVAPPTNEGVTCFREGTIRFTFDKDEEGWKAAGGKAESVPTITHTTSNDAGEGGSIVISDRVDTTQGPMLVTGWLYEYANHCLKPVVAYVLTIRYRLTKDGSADKTTEEEETTCYAKGENCLTVNIRSVDQEGEWRWRALHQATPVTAARTYGTYHTLVAEIHFPEEEVKTGERLIIFGPEAGVNIEIDYFDISLPPVGIYPQQEGKVCTDLVYANNGGNHGGNTTLPFYGAYGRPLVLGTEPDEDQPGSKNIFFRVLGRERIYHSMTMEFLTGCIQFGATYEFSARIRVHTSNKPEGVTVKVQLEVEEEEGSGGWATQPVDIVTTCPTQKGEDGWVYCKGSYTFPIDGFGAITSGNSGNTKYRLIFAVHEDETSIVDYDNIHFRYHEGPKGMTNRVVLPATTSKCWGIGSEILFAPHTSDWDGGQVRRIANMVVNDDTDDAFAVVTLDRPIYRPRTKGEYPDTATEVALLSRKVRIEAELDHDMLANHHGGHFMVLHTPNVPQRVEGVEFKHMGQQGRLDRYPMHFHTCDNIEGTVVRNNVIRDSLQRCAVLKGTHNVTFEGNVAYNSYGHCFALEDGTERDNAFVKNLAVYTRPLPDDRQIGPDESDDRPSLFYANNADNTWLRNVAAGSAYSGFGYEYPPHKPPADGWPTALPPSQFKDNAAHSNKVEGTSNAYFFPMDTTRSYLNGDQVLSEGKGGEVTLRLIGPSGAPPSLSGWPGTMRTWAMSSIVVGAMSFLFAGLL